jgi:sigma-E factor negative regulatory protein RseA
MNEELDSQLSAMFDDELSHAECELLARRLSRDAELKARWGRYAMIAAAIRAERGVRLHAQVARRVSAVVVAEPALAAAAPARGAQPRWLRPAAGFAVAAGVAAVSIMWLRWHTPEGGAGDSPPVAATAAPAALGVSAPAQAPPVVAAVAPRASPGSDTYVVPPAPRGAVAVVPATELASYVVAHSMFTQPVTRGNLLSSFITSGSEAAGNLPVSDAQSSAR